MRGVLLGLVLALVAAALFTVAEPIAPQATVANAPTVVGRDVPLEIVARDRGTGLASVEVRLVPEGATEGIVIVRQDFPRTSWLGSGVHETTLLAGIAPQVSVPEGPAQLEVRVRDHSWLAAFSRKPQVARPVTIDLTPPGASLLSEGHTARQGGSQCVVFRVDPDATEATVTVGDLEFSAVAGFFADPALRVALVAIPWQRADAPVHLVVRDAAGNVRRVAVPVVIKPRAWPQKTLVLGEDFLQRKVPELLAENHLDTSGSLIDGYLRINRELRRATEARIVELTRSSTPTVLWEGAFGRLPNSAPLSGFADHRTYVHQGKVIDEQTHLGFDLASLKRAVVPAANTGRVVFTGSLGIYGQTVLLDHGLGLFSLYGHLSEIGVSPGAIVRKGDALGKTGDTGLAGGDHLHFSVMIHGTHVDPVEWWDGRWIKDQVLARLSAYPRAAVASPLAPEGESRPIPDAAAGARR